MVKCFCLDINPLDILGRGKLIFRIARFGIKPQCGTRFLSQLFATRAVKIINAGPFLFFLEQIKSYQVAEISDQTNKLTKTKELRKQKKEQMDKITNERSNKSKRKQIVQSKLIIIKSQRKFFLFFSWTFKMILRERIKSGTRGK